MRTKCPYLEEAYLGYLSRFRLQPSKHLEFTFTPAQGGTKDEGDLHITVKGPWVETILYEIPLLALTSAAYFKFCNTDWDYDGQEEKAYQKGCTLLQNGCLFSEFGTRRRRDYKTQDLVMQGLSRAAEDGAKSRWPGKLTGTSNVHLAMRYDVAPIGTVAHEWYMGIAAITDNYEDASELALKYWLSCFGEGVLGIALTDTFGTPAFFKAFTLPVPSVTTAAVGEAATLPSAATSTTTSTTQTLTNTKPPLDAPLTDGVGQSKTRSYAQVFAGVRQDSGNPKEYVKMAREFYDQQGIEDKKTIVFSDSLNIDKCLEYKEITEASGFQPSFGIGTFLTNDFVHKSNGKKSVPLNIVIKLSHAGGRPAVKISDNIGKNTGDPRTVHDVKVRLGYVEREWREGDEAFRWGREGT